MRKGAIPQPIPIGQPTALVAADLERLKQPRFVASTPQKLRDSHHMIARLAAAGLRPFEIEQKTTYSRVRIIQLLASPAMEELVAQYRKKVDDTFVESVDKYVELATGNMLAAERHIADRIAELDEQGELLEVRTALAISRDAADRFGYGKKSQVTNLNVDFAAQLERAIARSGKQIEGTTAQPSSYLQQAGVPPSFPRTSSVPVPAANVRQLATAQSSRPTQTQQPAAQAQPLIRRRA